MLYYDNFQSMGGARGTLLARHENSKKPKGHLNRLYISITTFIAPTPFFEVSDFNCSITVVQYHGAKNRLVY